MTASDVFQQSLLKKKPIPPHDGMNKNTTLIIA